MHGVHCIPRRNIMRYNLTLEEATAKKLKDLSEQTGTSELDLIRLAVEETLSVSGDFVEIRFKKFFGSLNKSDECEDVYLFTYNPQIKTGKIESVKEVKKVPKCVLSILKERYQYAKFIKDITIYAYSIRINEDLYFIYCYDQWQNIKTNIADHLLDSGSDSDQQPKVYAIDRVGFMSFFEEVK